MIKNIFTIVITISIMIVSQLTIAQLQASNWYFGFNAGINFDPNTGAVTAITDGQINTFEGCATISDENGDLLFYTDGSFIFNRNHLIMQNGQGLLGDPSSTQSAIIIPKPLDPNIYYIFTVDTGGAGESGLNYYEVDMTLDGGLGAVTTNTANPVNLIPQCSEKVTAINRTSSDEILITALANRTGFSAVYDSYWTFKIDTSGVSNIPLISIVNTLPPGFGSSSDRRGNLKISPDGRYLASCNMRSGSYLYDYDNNTGAVSNPRTIAFNGPNTNGYGVEFSPDSRLLYITASNDSNGAAATSHQSTLYQLDLTTISAGAMGSIDIIDTRLGYRGALQLGIDGKIYRALSDSYDNGRSFLGLINNPNALGRACNYVHDAIPLSGQLSAQGLPPFIQSYFALIEVDNTCLGDTTEFSFQTDTPPTSVLWDFGDGTTSTLENPQHTYLTAGIYNVTLELNINGATRTYRKNVQIYDVPVANSVTNVSVCDLDFDGGEQIDLNAFTATVLGNQDPTIFNVRYYRSLQELNDNRSGIALPYSQDIGSQTLYARISNTNNSECFDLTSFTITVYEQPVANSLTNLESCDDNFDGIETFNLNSQNATLLGIQNASAFNISYHLNQNDANSGSNPLSGSYRNTTPFLQTIYARIVNAQSPACAYTTSFNLIVNAKPTAANTSAFQCDEDGVIDSRTLFNLSQFDNTIAGSATGVVVTYHPSLAMANSNTNALDNTNYRNTSPLQVIYARVTNTTTGCFNTSQVTLSVSASDAQDTQLGLCDDDGTQDGFRLFDLNLANGNVLVNAPANVTVNYYESLNDALTELNPLPTLYTNTVANNQVIYARAESPDGNCFGISEVELIVNPLPVVEALALIEYCGNNPQPLTIDAGPLPGLTTDYTYLWNTGATTYAIQTVVDGDFTVDVINSNGCSTRRTVTVIISEPATITGIGIVHAGSSATGSAIINFTGTSDYEFRIDPDTAYQDSNVFENLPPGLYTAYANDKNGCGVSRQDFSIIGYPRFFTPNNDGYNDFWQLIGVSVVFEPNSIIYIFDRYGKLVKQISPEGPGWDGTYNNITLPSSDYWFTATLMDGTTFKGHFTLKR